MASLSDLHGSCQSLSSPVSVEVSSGVVSETQGIEHFNNLDMIGKASTSPEIEVGHALRRLEEQLSLDDDKFKEYLQFGNQKSYNISSLNQGSASSSNLHGSSQRLSSPGTVEVSSEVVAEGQGMQNAANICTSPHIEVNHTLRKLEEQLSLGDEKYKEYFSYDNQIQDEDGYIIPGSDRGVGNLDQGSLQQDQFYGRNGGQVSGSTNCATWQGIGLFSCHSIVNLVFKQVYKLLRLGLGQR